MSGRRGAGGPVRQLSLHTPPAQTRSLSKQSSEDFWSPRSTPSLRVSSALPGSVSVAQLPDREPPRRLTPSPGPVRPRPVRLAWADRRPEASSPRPTGNVELVAKRCTGQPRPMPVSRALPSAASSLLPTVGDSRLSMSRHQLAERLRKAWQDRRPNLDIFLAPSNDPSEHEDDALSTSRSTVGEESRQLSNSSEARVAIKVTRPSTEGNAFSPSQDFKNKTDLSIVPSADVALSRLQATNGDASSVSSDSSDHPHVRFSVFPYSGVLGQATKLLLEGCASDPDDEPDIPTRQEEPEDVIGKDSPLEESASDHQESADSPPTDSATFSCELAASPPLKDDDDEEANESVHSQDCIQKDDSKDKLADSKKVSGKLDSPEVEVIVPPLTVSSPVNKTTAASRRMNFRNSGKTFLSASTSSLPSPATISQQSRPRTATPSGRGGPPMVRALSSAASSSSPATAPRGILISRSRLQSAGSLDVLDVESSPRDREVNSRVKSAPVRGRKLKTAARRTRTKGANSDSSDESRERDKDKDKDKDKEKEKEKDKEKDKKNSRLGRRGVGRAQSEVITMVSLLSPGDSGTESDGEVEALMSPLGTGESSAMPTPIQVLTNRTQVSTADPTPIAFLPLRGDVNAHPSEQAGAGGSPAGEDSNGIRKPPKSVWFQQPSPVAVASSVPSSASTYIQHYSTSCRAGPGLTAVPSLAFLSEKRAPSVSVESRTAKRRLTRALSVPSGYDDLLEGESAVAPRIPGASVGLAATLNDFLRARESRAGAPSPVDGDDDGGEDDHAEPEFNTPKERECWELFRKMTDKGVSVSYDTVLRGMLTPTEYRMRRNSLLSGF